MPSRARVDVVTLEDGTTVAGAHYAEREILRQEIAELKTTCAELEAVAAVTS